RINYIPLNHHLSRTKKIESPSYLHCQDWDEMATHVLLHCPHYSAQCGWLHHITSGRSRPIPWLLGNPKGIIHTL
ncbi:hypothetical protein L210DRAFT_3402918, partial [Boletus edulis BED1]